MPHSLDLLIAHARQHLRRVYPKGTRVTSDNQDPVAQWRNGSHIVCLNWQKYDAGMQMNEALFVGTPGWVLKPPHMLLREQDSAPKPQRMRLVGEIAGVSSRKRSSSLKKQLWAHQPGRSQCLVLQMPTITYRRMFE